MSIVNYWPQDSSDKILDVVKSSNLHFNIQETPHSVYITIRKKFVQEPPVTVPNQIYDQQLASLENAYSNLKDNLEEEIDNHTESQKLIKILEDKLENTEAKFITESNKFKAEKESFENQIKHLKESNRKNKETVKSLEAIATKSEDPHREKKKCEAKIVKLEEKANDLLENKEITDDNQNNFVSSIPVSNKFQALASNLDGISSLWNSSTFDLSSSTDFSSKTFPRTPPSPASKLPSPATPPPQDKELLTLSFRNFLEDFRNSDGDVKYLRRAKEMISYSRKVMDIEIDDIQKHNQFLSDEVRKDYYGLYNSLTSAFRNFMADKVDSTSGKEYHILIDLDKGLKKQKTIVNGLKHT